MSTVANLYSNSFVFYTNSSSINESSDTISIANANTYLSANDLVKYVVPDGSSPISGLDSNNAYYVTFSNSSSIALSLTKDGPNVSISPTEENDTNYLYKFSNTNALTLSPDGTISFAVFDSANDLNVSYSSTKIKISDDSEDPLTVSNSSSNVLVVKANGNVLVSKGIIANNSLGSAGQILTTNGSGIYWSSSSSGGNGTVTSVASGNGLTGGPITTTGTLSVLANNGITTNSTGLFVTQGTGVVVNSIGVHVNSAYIGTLSANNTTYVNGKTEGNLNVNNATTVGGNTASTLRTYSETTASNAYTNAVSYVDGKSYVNTSQLSSNLSNYQTTAGLASNVATLSANNADYLDGQHGSYYTNATNISTGTLAEARLPYRMNQNVTTSNDVTFGSLTLTGNLTVSGNVTVIGANNLSVVDNMIYLNSNNTIDNEDIGVVGNYNTTGNSLGYAHTGIFRDASDGYWKVFDGYKPEPDANVNIDTSNNTFQLANFQANLYAAGNTSTNWFVANTSGAYHTGTVNAASHTVGTSTIANSTGVYTGTVNAASHTVGTSFTANSTVTNTVSLVVSTNTATIGTGSYFVSNGNVGIGTATPAGKLDVYGGYVYVRSPGGTSAIEVGAGQTSNQYSYIDLVGDTTYSDYGLRILRGNTGPNTFSTIEHRGSGSLIFNSPDSGGSITLRTATIDRFFVASNGNIGIGNSSPAHILSVNGGALVNTHVSVGNSTINAVVNSTSLYFNSTTSAALVIAKPASNSSLNYRFDVGPVGGNNAVLSGPFWNGWHFAAPVITLANSSLTYPRTSFYYSYTNTTAPTDMYFNIVAGNDSGLGTGIKLYAFDGTNRGIDIAANGNVGIGTSSPANLLDVAGMIRMNSATQYTGITLQNGTYEFAKLYGQTATNDNGVLSLNLAGTTNVLLRASGTNYINGGNVGIGTSAPVTRLQVGTKVIDDASYTYDTNTLMAVHQTATGTSVLNDPKPVLMLARQGSAGQAFGAAAQFNLSRYENAGGSNVGSRTRLDFTLAHDTFMSSNTIVMTMLSSGNVGIGTTSPSTKLDVTGQIRSLDGTVDLRMLPLSGSSVGILGTLSNHALVLYSNNTERVRIIATGDVGIGNSSPSHKLSVNGTTYLQANVTLNSGLIANGSIGTAGQVLHSNGSATYWAADDTSGSNGTVTSVATGNGLTGGPITSTGTISVLANTGIIANATGLYVNSSYIEAVSSNNASYVQRYSIPNTGAATGWVNLGTFAATQDGDVLKIKINAISGYNADINQNQITEIFFKTSNGTSNTGGFLGDGYAYTFGPQTNAPTTIRIVQSSSTSYVVHANFGTFSGTSFYEIAHNGTSWTHSGTNNGATAPTGTYIDVTKYKIWTELSDGSGSGLDADTLDGLQGSAYAALSGATFTGNITPSTQSNSGGGLWYFGSSAWGGNVGGGVNSVTGLLYSGGTGSQLFTFGSGPGQMSVQADGSLFAGGVPLSYNPHSINGASDGFVACSGGMSSGGIIYSNASVRAPQFYDSDNTGFYIDAASSSRLSTIYSDQYRILNGGVFIWQHDSAGANNKFWDTYSGSDGTLNFRTVNDTYTAAVNWLTVTRSGNSPQVITLGGSYTTAAGSLRAPIFYDSDDTGYYVNPNSTSKFYDIWNNAGYMYFQSTQHKRITSNDGGGNWNFRAGNYMNAGVLQYINNGANSGAATISFSCDSSDGIISLLCAPIGVAGANVSYTGSAGLDRYGTFGASGDLRAPRYYDSDNTAYYIDGAGASVLTRVSLFSGTTSALHVNDVAGASSFNYVMSAANDTGNKLVAFVNGSTRNTDGGNNAVVIRNDGGPFVLGSTSQVTTVAGSYVGIPTDIIVSGGTDAIQFNNATSNYISWNSAGVAAPTFTTRSAGTKLVLYPAIGAASVDYGLGIENNTLWFSTTTTSSQFKWYGGTTLAMTLSGAGQLTLVNNQIVNLASTSLATFATAATASEGQLIANFTGQNTAYLFNNSVAWGLYSASGGGIISYSRSNNRADLGAAYTQAAGSLRAPIFYDSDDTISRWSGNDLVMRGTSPTVYFRDTDHNSAMIHVNSNLFYVLRGGNDTETWTQVNSQWPLTINLTNNDCTIGGDGYSAISFRAPIFYDSADTNYYLNPNGGSQVAGHFRIGPYAGSATSGNVTGLEIMNNGGTGDSNLAAMSFHCQATYGVHLHLRNDGVFGLGGWSASSYRWYVDLVNSITYMNGQSRSTIHYDLNDTNYYSDPNGTSRINNLTVVGTGGRTLIATLTASNSTALQTTNAFSTGYKFYEVIIDDLLPATNAVEMRLQFYNGSYLATGYISYASLSNIGGSLSSGPTTYMSLSATTRVRNTTGFGYRANILFVDPANTGSFVSARGYYAHSDSTNAAYLAYGECASIYTTNTGCTGFQVYASSGNLTSGTITIWGWN